MSINQRRQELIRKNREKQLAQIEFEKMLAEKIRNEPDERNYTDEPLTAFQTAGGGRRIVRKGHEMS